MSHMSPDERGSVGKVEVGEKGQFWRCLVQSIQPDASENPSIKASVLGIPFPFSTRFHGVISGFVLSIF